MLKALKSNKPLPLSLTQQKMKSWSPVLSPIVVFSVFAVIFVIFLGIGLALLFSTINSQEIEIDYTDLCVMGKQLPAGNFYCQATNISFTPTQTLTPPIYLYYRLSNFYQNHRRYVASRSEAQLGGKMFNTAQCSGMFDTYNPTTDKVLTGNTTWVKENSINPCGLIAWSKFNDTISLFDESNNLICNGGSPDEVKCSKKGIAWWSDTQFKFKNPAVGSDGIKNRMSPKTYWKEPTHQIPETIDEDFIVWARTAALPDFRKLYRVINVQLTKGKKYNFIIDQHFPVKSFNGRKYVVLSKPSWLGGKSWFLAILYLVVSGFSCITAVFFLFVGVVRWIIRLRNKYNYYNKN